MNAAIKAESEDAIRKLKELLTSASEFGYEKKPNGAELYGHVPHVAAQAWLHTMYPGLQPFEVDQLEQQIARQIPPEYSWWLGRSNGLDLYSGALSFYGLVRLRSRTVDNRQPFELFLEGEVQRRVLKAEAALFFFGGSSEANGFHFYLDTRTGAVHRCARGSATSLQSWSGIAELIAVETQRLETLFDNAGRCMVDSDLLWP